MVDIMDKIHLNNLVGIPFKSGGRDIQNGLDCWGLVIETYKRFGIKIPDITIRISPSGLVAGSAGMGTEKCRWKEVYYPKDNDIPLTVLMQIHQKYITHAGVLVSRNRLLHTTKCTGSILTRLDAIKSHVIGYYRYVEDN